MTELISQSCLNQSYRAKANLKIRPVFEWEGCLVYTPDTPKLHVLNLSSFFVLQTCVEEAISGDAIFQLYKEVYMNDKTEEEAHDEVVDCLESLKLGGMIEVAGVKM